jgi:hypothetical protein
MTGPAGSGIRERLDGARRHLACFPHVTGVGVGWKETRGLVTGTPAWRVYVRRKPPARALAAGEIVPPWFDGLATDIVLSAAALPSASLPGEAPLAPGAAISNLRGIAHDGGPPRHPSGLGTLGFFALRNGSRQREVVLVSNRHVLLAHRAGKGDPIYHPVLVPRGEGWVIRGDTIEPVAEILDEGVEGHHRFRYPDSAGESYFVDCATASLIRQFPNPQPTVVRGAARLHTLDVIGGRAPVVHKIGCATGVKYGRVVDVAAQIETAAGESRLETIVIRGDESDFTGPGDSGAVLLNRRNQAVGLVWGRSQRDSRVAYASHIHPVLDRLNITLMNGVS